MNTHDTTETTPLDQTDFSIRSFLGGRQAILVHFSTLMSNHPGLVFPDDLRQAAGLADVPLSFSTIMAGDVGPYQRPDMHSVDANAGGSIGIIVDIPSNDSVVTVGANDDGTSFNPSTGEIISGGYAPTPESCAQRHFGRPDCGRQKDSDRSYSAAHAERPLSYMPGWWMRWQNICQLAWSRS
jgi:hypothetical protein